MKLIGFSRLLKTPMRKVGQFKLVEDLALTDKDPQMMVSKKYGFLPREEPLFDTPPEFETLESLLNRAVINQPDGTKGLLASGQFGNAVLNELKVVDVSKIESTRLLEALMRDYAFASAMYLLEPCDLQFKKDKTYGLARDHLPESIAIPLCKLADKLGVKPCLEYNHYAPYNWQKKDKSKGMEPTNLQPKRLFEGSQDEIYFVVVHLYMLEQSGKIIEYMCDIFNAVEANDRSHFNKALANMVNNSKIINRNMDTMWELSSPKKYNDIRTFIMGSKNQPMYPNGILYKGVSEERRFYRGETGANDSMVPTLDNIFELTAEMPENPLTETLRDFRTYRPKNHQEFLIWAEARAKELGVKKFALEDSNSTVLYLANLDQLAEFRERHWRFTKEYIIKNSTHPVATGGSPITTWLPNQLGVVLGSIDKIGSQLDVSKLSNENKKLNTELVKRAHAMRSILTREVEELKKKFKGQDL